MKVFAVYAQNAREMWRKAVGWQANCAESKVHGEKLEYDLRLFAVYAQRQLWWCQKCGICGEDEAPWKFITVAMAPEAQILQKVVFYLVLNH